MYHLKHKEDYYIQLKSLTIFLSKYKINICCLRSNCHRQVFLWSNPNDWLNPCWLIIDEVWPPFYKHKPIRLRKKRSGPKTSTSSLIWLLKCSSRLPILHPPSCSAFWGDLSHVYGSLFFHFSSTSVPPLPLYQKCTDAGLVVFLPLMRKGLNLSGGHSGERERIPLKGG